MTERGAENSGSVLDVSGGARRLVDLAHCAGMDSGMAVLADEVFDLRGHALKVADNIEDGSVRPQLLSPSGSVQQWESDDGRIICTRLMDGESWVTFVHDAVWGELESCEAVFRDDSGSGSAQIDFCGGKVTNVRASVISRDSVGTQVPSA